MAKRKRYYCAQLVDARGCVLSTQTSFDERFARDTLAMLNPDFRKQGLRIETRIRYKSLSCRV